MKSTDQLVEMVDKTRLAVLVVRREGVAVGAWVQLGEIVNNVENLHFALDPSLSAIVVKMTHLIRLLTSR